jgi:probable HAF family extracellular repeat protein
MKFNRLPLITLVALTILSISSPAGGQDASLSTLKRTPRYKLVDIGTFGGRASYVVPPWELGSPNQMNRRGATVGTAATIEPTSFLCPFCDGLDGQVFNVFHAFQWSGGELEDLGALPGELTSSEATGINDEGWVVGNSENGQIDPLTGTSEIRAVVWQHGQIRNLGTFGGNHSFVSEVNNRGEIIGLALNTIPDPVSFLGSFYGSTNLTQTRAFLWEDGHKRDLGTLGGPDAVPNRINDRSEVTGGATIDSVPNPTTGLPTYHPFLWRKGRMIDLGNCGGTLAGGTAINTRGQIVGSCNLPGDEFSDPFFWEDGKFIDLYTSSTGGNPITVYALNDRGQAVGGGAFADHPYDAYVWKKGVATDLGFLEGDCYSEAFVIGSNGQIAGQSYPCELNSRRPFLWQDGTMFDLNEVTQVPTGFRFTQAFVINDRGEIGGIGTAPGCDDDEDCGHAMVLIPCTSGESDSECEQHLLSEGIANTAAPLPSKRTPLTSTENLTARELAARLQSRFGRRHILGLAPLR